MFFPCVSRPLFFHTAILFEDALFYDPKMRIASAFVMLSVTPKSMHWEYIFSISPCTAKARSIVCDASSDSFSDSFSMTVSD